MRDGEWSLVYEGASLTFGIDKPIWNITAPELGDVDIEAADARRARQDGVDFGVDFFGGRTITFDIGVTGTSETEARANAAKLARTWRADAVRSTPGAVAELHSCYRGQERVTFGRPRKFAADLKGARTQKLIEVDATFEASDDRFYGAGLHSTAVSLVPQSPTGGLEFPIAFPWSTTASSDRSTTLVVDSELPVWPVITIEGGQVVNPVVEVVGLWRMEFRTTIDYDRTLVIDTQPWARSILLDGGASLAGTLSRDSTRLRNAAIPSGNYRLRFTAGGSTDRAATASIGWRDAYSTP